MKLTDVACRNAKPSDRPQKLSDGFGLFLLVQPTGGKLWRFSDSIELEYVAKAGIRHMRRRGYEFKLMQPTQIPLDTPLHDIRGWLISAKQRPSLAVILYVEQSDFSHWSVLKSVSGKRVTLFDSDRMSSAALSRCEPVFILTARE